MNTLPTDPGPNVINIEDHLTNLFEMEKEIFNIPPLSFASKTPEKLLQFLTKDRKTSFSR